MHHISFLELGYCVIFVTKSNSVQPFERHFNKPFEILDFDSDTGKISIKDTQAKHLHKIFTEYQKVNIMN